MANQTEGSGYEAPTRWVADMAITLEPHVHAVQRGRLLCAKALGYTPADALRFGLVGKDCALSAPLPKHLGHAENPFVPRKPLVALVHGTSRADKEWPLDHWVALGRRLNNAGFCVACPMPAPASCRPAGRSPPCWSWRGYCPPLGWMC